MLSIDPRKTAARVGLATAGLVVATAIAGCSAGQVSQVATQEPAVNGTTGNIGQIALRNVHIQASSTGDALEPGSDVDLVLAAANNSASGVDRRRKYESRLANAKSSSFPEGSRRNRKSGEQKMAVTAVRSASSFVAPCSFSF